MRADTTPGARLPFPAQEPRSYSKEGIEWLNGGQKGCYGLIQRSIAGDAWIYVGKADDIRSRLLGHVNGDNPCIDRYRPTRYLALVTDANDAREKELIAGYHPVCNKKIG